MSTETSKNVVVRFDSIRLNANAVAARRTLFMHLTTVNNNLRASDRECD